MNFIQQPSGTNFAGNICDIIIESVNDQGFGLSVQGGGSILKEEYRPVGGRITVPLRDIMQRVAVTASVAPGVVELPTYQYQFGEDAFQTFTCLNGGVEADVDAIGFFENNWLTWQQQVRRTTFHAPQRLCYAVLDEPSAYKVKVRGYFADNTNSQITLCTLTKRGIHTLDVTYGAISGKFEQQIVAFDVWVEVRAGVNSYTQRYILVDEIYSADYFMWVNSLGGIDTAIFTGELKEDNKYQTNNAIIDGSESEYNTKIRKAFTKYTGYLGSDNERLWVLDFFNSTKRWHLDDGILRQITVSSPKLEHTRGELMGYEFTFSHSRQSKYLNITRIEVPELLEIVDPSGELFFLAPRLIQFKSAEVSSAEILFPVQYPHSKEWLQLTLTQIIQLAAAAGSDSGQTSIHAASHAKGGTDPITPASIGAAEEDHNHDDKFHPHGGSTKLDFAAKVITAIKGIFDSIEARFIKADKVEAAEVIAAEVITDEVRSENYTSGALSEGYRIYTNPVTGESTAIFHNIEAKNGITAPMFTVRLMAATGGIDVTSAANAKLTNVVDGGSYWQCFYKCAGQLWKPLDQARIQNEFGGFLWGLVTAASAQPNDRGEYSFNISKTTVASGSNRAPKVDDVVVLYGHRGADKYRQSLFIKSCGVDNPEEDYEPYEAKYVAINSFSLPKNKCTKWDGLTFDIAVNSFTIIGRDGSMYQQPNDRGGHVSGTTYYAFDRVSLDGSLWQCVVDSTTTTPSDGASDWVCVVPKGGKGDKGDKGNYEVRGYCWAQDKPARPVGSSPEGWSAGSDRGMVILDESDYLLTDESGALLLNPYPESCRLWGSTATFDSATGEVVGEWSDPYQMTGQDGKDGPKGINTAPIILYKRSATKPAAPTNTSVWNFANKGFSTAPDGGWTTDIPTSNGQPCWSTNGIASSNTESDSIPASEWSDVQKLVEDGQKGGNGSNSAVATLYARGATAPAKPTTALTYTFATGKLTGALADWSQEIPASNGQPCFVIQAVAFAVGASDTIAAAEWSGAVKLVEDGAAGKDAPKLKVKFSVDGSTKWHEVYVEADRYRCESNDGGTTWGAALRMWGEGGPPGADGKKTPYTDFSYGYGLSQPTAWSDAPPAKVDEQHLWERIQKYTPKDDNSGWTLASTSYAIISEYVEIGGVNRIFDSRYDSFKNVSNSSDWAREIITDAKFGKVLQLHRVAGSGGFQTRHPKVQLTNQQIVFAVIAKQVGTGGSWLFGGWSETFGKLSSNSSTIDLGDGWKLYWSTFRSGASINSSGAFGINTITGKWQFYACAMYAGNRPPTDWSPAPEDVQAEIDAAKEEALKLRLFQGEFKAGTAYFNNSRRQDIVRYGNLWYSYIGTDGVAASWSAANWKSYLSSAKSFATELLLAEEANIANFLFRGGKLTSQTLGDDGKPNLSLDGLKGIIKATEGNFGSAHFDSAGTLTIKTSEGETVSTFTRGDINTLSKLLEGNELGSSALTGFSVSSGASDKFEVSVTLAGSITTNAANVDITVSGVELTAWVSGITQGVRASARAELFNDKGEVFSLGWVGASTDSDIRHESKTIQFTGKMATAGTYRVRVVYSMSGIAYGDLSNANISVSGGTISKLFTKATNESQLGRGLAVIFDSLNYLHYGNNPANNNRKEFIYRGWSDLPGVLRAGTVNSDGTNGGAWGATKATPKRVSQGVYKITHNIGHKEYFFNGTLVGSFTGAVKRLAKQTSYVDVEVRGLDGNLYDCEFDYQITGANYV